MAGEGLRRQGQRIAFNSSALNDPPTMPEKTPVADRHATPPFIDVILAAVLFLAIGWFYTWTVLPEPRPGLVGKDGNGYYNLQTRGFLKGELSLDMPADPFLATLKNPWDPAQREGHGPHDASYYRGRYYMYFGVTPVVLLFLPFRLLTGQFIDESLASLVFSLVGFAISAALVVALRRRYFPRSPMLALAGAILCVGMVQTVPILLRRASVWEVPITCAYACFAGALGAIYLACHSRHRAAWIAVASAALGLAVGARPVYLPGCLALAVPLFWELRRAGGLRKALRDRTWLRFLAGAVIPAGLIGAGLAGYNIARFGSVMEFGQRYQISGDNGATVHFFNPRFLGYGLRLYWFEPAGWSPYFPYVMPVAPPPRPLGQLGVEDPYGIVPNMPFIVVGLGLLAVASRRRGTVSPPLGAFCLATLVGSVLTAMTVMSFGGITNRYMVDFVPGLAILASVGLLAIAETMSIVWAIVVGAILTYSALFNVLASVRHNELMRAEHPDLYRALVHRWNEPSHLIDLWTHRAYGPVEMKVIFPTGEEGHNEPLVVTGQSFLADYLFVHYVTKNSVLFGMEHTSRGVTLGDPVTVKAGEVHTLLIDMGSLYPPAGHPYFDKVHPTLRYLLPSTVSVRLDGQVVLLRRAEFYDANAWTPSIGTSDGRPGYTHPFSGRIVSWRRAPEAGVQAPPDAGVRGKLLLEVTLPPFTEIRSEPILSTGETGRGDLVYVKYLSARQIALGYDHWGVGGPLSAALEVDPSVHQRIEIDTGAIDPANPGRLILKLNNQTIFDLPEPFYASDPDRLAIGTNAIHASTAAEVFTGLIKPVEGKAKGGK